MRESEDLPPLAASVSSCSAATQSWVREACLDPVLNAQRVALHHCASHPALAGAWSLCAQLPRPHPAKPDRGRLEHLGGQLSIVNCHLSTLSGRHTCQARPIPSRHLSPSILPVPVCLSVYLSVTDSLACHCPPPCRILYCTNTVVACCPLPAAPCCLSGRCTFILFLCQVWSLADIRCRHLRALMLMTLV